VTIRHRFAANIVLIATIIALQACSTQEKLGAATPDRVVERYLLALETKDEQMMAKLQPEAAANKMTAAIIERLGGHKLQNPRITYIKTKPTLWQAKITGTYLDRNNIQQKFEDNIAIVYEGEESWKLYSGRWFLVLGKDKINAL
jgi:hypothetical protein